MDSPEAREHVRGADRQVCNAASSCVPERHQRLGSQAGLLVFFYLTGVLLLNEVSFYLTFRSRVSFYPEHVRRADREVRDAASYCVPERHQRLGSQAGSRGSFYITF